MGQDLAYAFQALHQGIGVLRLSNGDTDITPQLLIVVVTNHHSHLCQILLHLLYTLETNDFQLYLRMQNYCQTTHNICGKPCDLAPKNLSLTLVKYTGPSYEEQVQSCVGFQIHTSINSITLKC